jgi:phosphatidylethanolamine/phosphatidyl-N-methylethanolamine N-methyltransferase
MSDQTERFYNTFSFFYPMVDLFLRPQKRLLHDEINKLASGELLDIGVGNGAHLHYYNTHRITGIDTSSTMLAIAARKNKSNVTLLQMDGEALAFHDNSFDYVVLSHVIAVVDHPEQLLAEVRRVLRPNGKLFILNHFTPDNPLRHVDRSFQLVARRLHFRAFFHTHDLEALSKLLLLKEVTFGPFSYFKLLIYQKQ